MKQITIIGLGLIGGSLGLAWRQAMPDVEIVGHDNNPAVGALARKNGAVDHAEWNLPAAVEKADVVVLATPVVAMRDTLEFIAECLPDGCIVTDTGSTKRQVMAWADELLPPTVTFIGGHPMAGKELAGIEAADADLFAGRTFCISPSASADASAIDTICDLVAALGAEPYFVDAAEHDGLVAGISHLPFILSAALTWTTANSPSWREMSRLAASGYESMTRLAGGDPTMHANICSTNRENILRWLDAYAADLVEFRSLIADESADLATIFASARESRVRWLAGEVDEQKNSVEIPGLGQQFGKSLLGDRLFDLGREDQPDKRS